MLKLIKKEKTIISIIIVILLIGIFYYIYTNQNMIDTKEERDFIEDINETDDKEENSEKKNMLIVHVSGAVNNEGILELEEGSRISDAIEKAGGLKKEAYTRDINLACKVEDEMKIYIPTIDEKKEGSEEKESNTDVNISTKGNVKVNSSINMHDKNNKININKATKSELENLPGIGESTASKIIEYRNQNGKFKAIEDIKNVKGIGESKFNNIKDKISI